MTDMTFSMTASDAHMSVPATSVVSDFYCVLMGTAMLAVSIFVISIMAIISLLAVRLLSVAILLVGLVILLVLVISRNELKKQTITPMCSYPGNR